MQHVVRQEDFFFVKKQFKSNQKNHVLSLFTLNFSLKKNGNKIYSSFRLMLFLTLTPLLFTKQKYLSNLILSTYSYIYAHSDINKLEHNIPGK